MDRVELYDRMAIRKSKPKDLEDYHGGNGRVDRCVQLMRQGKIHTGGTLLDVGGGIGDLGFATRDLFDRRIILDISEKNIEVALEKGNETIVTDVDAQGLAYVDDGSVDVVTALDFIEHIIDPENFARECHRVLKPAGEVFINTPNIRFWKHINQLWLEGTFPHTSGDREIFHGGHLAFYCYKDLRQIFEPAGFVSSPQYKDEECYEQPPDGILRPLEITNQPRYQEYCLELGSPNLLYRAISIK